MNYDNKRALSHYRVIPRLVKIGTPQTVTIYPIGKSKCFDKEKEYTLTLYPAERFPHTWVKEGALESLTVRPRDDGAISFTYTFTGEQEWTISVKE